MKRYHRFNAFALIITGLLLLGVMGCSKEREGIFSAADPLGYIAADGMRGGKLYDKFWAAETGWDQSDTNVAIYREYPAFFRCVHCHGWDLLGSEGAFISNAPSTDRPRVSAPNLRTIAARMTPRQLFDALERSDGRRPVTADLSGYDPNANPHTGDLMPDYGSILNFDQLWDLVRFLKLEAIDVCELYDYQVTGSYSTGSITFSNIGKDGNASRGDSLFAAKCSSCHGEDGAAILVDGGNFTAGRHLREKPYQDQHKFKFGELGSPMATTITDKNDMKDIYKALADRTRYPD